MQLLSTENQLSWSYQNIEVSVRLPGIVSSLADTRNHRVLAVVADEVHGDQLYAFGYDGTEIFRKYSPSDGRIYYLTQDPTHGALAVLTLKSAIQGWPDWHYSIGEQGELTRVSPAY